MSEENVEARARERMRRSTDGDIEALLHELDPDVEWHPSMQRPMLGGGTLCTAGMQGVRAMFRDFYDALAETFDSELSGDRGISAIESVAIGRDPGAWQGQRRRDRVALRVAIV